MTPQSLLITGGAGFIGANFVHYWIKNNPGNRIVVLDALTYAGNRLNLEAVEDHPGFLFVHGDIRDYDLVLSLLENNEINTIVHFAAESHVDRSIHGPDAFVDTNIVGTHTLLKAAKAVWLDSPPHSGQSLAVSYADTPLTLHSKFRFHHVSTDEVYGSLSQDDPPFSETTPYAPNSPYAASKASSDHLVRAYYKTYRLPITMSNCSNNYGPYQHPEKLIPLCIVNMIQGKSLPIYGDGLNVRDWLYVEDHCQGIELILQKGRIGEMYNIGGNCEKNNLDVVKTLCQIMDDLLPNSPYVPHAKLLTFVKDRPGHDRRYAINAEKISSELHYKPDESFQSGIRKTVKWYLENQNWLQSIMDENYQKWISKNY